MGVQVNVRVAGGNGGYRADPIELQVSGLENDLFIPGIEKAVVGQVGERILPLHLFGITWSDPDYPEGLQQIAGNLTFGQILEYFGAEVEAQPPTIHVDDGGYGGDATYIPYFIQLGHDLLDVGGAVSMTLAAQRALVAVRYGGFRQLAKDWNDSGVVSADLRDAVFNRGSWERREFDRTFALDGARGPELRRELGYQRRDYDWGEMWTRRFDDD